MRSSLLVISTLFTLSTIACDAKTEEAAAPKKTKSINELSQSKKDTRTPEELEKARKEAGFVDPKEEAEANIAAMEKGEREFIKTRVAKYREMTKGLRGYIGEIEKEAKAWAKAKNGQKAFDKFSETYKEDVRDFKASYNELTENGIRGGALGVTTAKIVRSWENINNDLSPTIANEANFDKSITDLRAAIDALEKEFDLIEKDETLKAGELEEEPKADDKKADKKGDKKKGG